MIQQTIMIKCPACGAVLTVKNQPGIETKNVPCPGCKQRIPFRNFQRVVPRKKVVGTVYPENYQNRRPSDSGSKQETEKLNSHVGQLCLLPSNQMFQLREGRNIIGRQATQSAATLQIPVTGSLRMSREHLVITVENVPGKGFVHVASLFKPKFNETRVGGKVLAYGDSVVLEHGCQIELPDATLVFLLK